MGSTYKSQGNMPYLLSELARDICLLWLRLVSHRRVCFLFWGAVAMSTHSGDSVELAGSDISLARSSSDGFGAGSLFC